MHLSRHIRSNVISLVQGSQSFVGMYARGNQAAHMMFDKPMTVSLASLTLAGGKWMASRSGPPHAPPQPSDELWVTTN